MFLFKNLSDHFKESEAADISGRHIDGEDQTLIMLYHRRKFMHGPVQNVFVNLEDQVRVLSYSNKFTGRNPRYYVNHEILHVVLAGIAGFKVHGVLKGGFGDGTESLPGEKSLVGGNHNIGEG